MTLHESSYRHWEGGRQGIWHRRGVIAFQGLRAALQGRWMRYLITASWLLALAQALLLFAIGQLLVTDSWAARWLGQLDGQLQAFSRALIGWLETHPEVSVRATQNLLFYHFATGLSTVSFLALALAIPHLITRDLSSNAIVVYASKAVSRFDYFLGKFAVVFGLMVLTWLGPVCAAWFLGNLLAPDWHFFWHSRRALGNTVAYVLISMSFLALLALGISAVSARERTSSAAWLGFWLLGNGLASIGAASQEWLRYFSFSFNLDQVAVGVFRIQQDIELARDSIPVFGQLLRGVRAETLEALREPALTGACVGMGVMLALAVWFLGRRVRPE